MREIMSVLGSVAPEELGFCQCHEHIALSKGVSYEINPTLCIDDIEKSLTEVTHYRSAGGSSLIDAQPCGCNRMPEALGYISEKSGVHILASTGFHKLQFYPASHWIHTASEKFLSSVFTDELMDGMYTDVDLSFTDTHCNYRAGIIKTALDTEGLTPRYRCLFSAAVNAAKQTERSIMIHVEQNISPLPLLDFLLSCGADPTRLIFCHMDRACPDMQLHLNLLKHGCFLEFDTIGRFKYHSDEHEVALFKVLINAGYETQLLYSLDTTSARLKSYEPQAVGLTYILDTFNALLLESGITKKQIQLFSIENCIRALTH